MEIIFLFKYFWINYIFDVLNNFGLKMKPSTNYVIDELNTWNFWFEHHFKKVSQSDIILRVNIVFSNLIFFYFFSILGHRIPDVPIPLFNVYPASKFALTALSQTIRQELTFQRANIKLTVCTKNDFNHLNGPYFCGRFAYLLILSFKSIFHQSIYSTREKADRSIFNFDFCVFHWKCNQSNHLLDDFNLTSFFSVFHSTHTHSQLVFSLITQIDFLLILLWYLNDY